MFHNKFMQTAIGMAKVALANGEVPVASLIVNPETNQIISKSHNLVEKNCDPTAHAEMLSIQIACTERSSKILRGFDLYVTLQPCVMCFQAAIYAKISRIYFGAYDQTMAIEVPKLANHHIDIYGGICELECKELLDRFFAAKR